MLVKMPFYNLKKRVTKRDLKRDIHEQKKKTIPVTRLQMTFKRVKNSLIK